MKFACEQSTLRGTVAIPGSKSHTIRAVTIAALAEGRSTIDQPLVSADTLSALRAVRALGANVTVQPDVWCIDGVAGDPVLREATVDVGNSGTTLRILAGAAALLPETSAVTLTGDHQVRARPNRPLIQALNQLGAHVESPDNDHAPLTVRGRLAGGTATVHGQSSQFLSSLLLACPRADRDTVLEVPVLCERPYVQMTLDWLADQGITVQHDAMRHFQISGGQSFRPFRKRIPGDFSSATFFFGAGALAGNDVCCTGLDLSDSQADKQVLDYLRAMGADISVDGDRVRVRHGRLHGIEIDMNETPDALPVMAVVACHARGTTTIRNVAHARIKETDRIAVMAGELAKMGADIDERDDGLVIRESGLHGACVDGHHDHRVVMALALAGMNAPGHTDVTTAEAAGVTFPDFATLMSGIGGHIVVRGTDDDDSDGAKH